MKQNSPKIMYKLSTYNKAYHKQPYKMIYLREC